MLSYVHLSTVASVVVIGFVHPTVDYGPIRAIKSHNATRLIPLTLQVNKTNTSMKFLVTAALLVSAVSALKVDLMNGKNAPSTGQEWVTIGPNGHEAQPGDFSKHPPEMAAKLRATFQRTLEGDGYKGYDMNFADSSVEYPDEQQAWRYLGLFVDCNPEANLDEENGDEEEGRELSGSQDNYDDTCTRYVLYAAVSSS